MSQHRFLKTAILLLQLLPALALAAPAPVVSAPLITPDQGAYSDSVDVAIYTATVGATIYYTTDGSIPTAASDPFTLPFTVTDSTTVKAIAIKTGSTNSAVSTAVFDISPVVEVPVPTIAVSGKKSLKTTRTSVTIRGISTGASSVQYQVGDTDSKTAQGTTAWSFKAKLKPGKNVIFVYASGEEDDSDTVKITVTLLKKK